MDFLEKVEKLHDKANISYEEAKAVLEETDGDLLDAIILLEKQSRLKSGEPEEPAGDIPPASDGNTKEQKKHMDGDAWRGFCRWVEELFVKGNRNSLQIRRGDNIMAAMPVTVFVAVILFAFWITVPLLIVGLYCGCSYSFIGPDLQKNDINKAWDKASQVAESIKEDIKKEMDMAEQHRKDK